MDNNARTFLILKFGSMEHAMSAWLYDQDEATQFTDDENQYMNTVAKERWPNLDLTRVVGCNQFTK